MNRQRGAQFYCANWRRACPAAGVFVNRAMVALPVRSEPASPFASNDGAPLVWVLHDGKAGMASQALGLAEATGFPFVEKSLSIRAPWAWLPPQLWIAPLRAAGVEDAALCPP